jgi:hypothetical protein
LPRRHTAAVVVEGRSSEDADAPAEKLTIHERTLETAVFRLRGDD